MLAHFLLPFRSSAPPLLNRTGGSYNANKYRSAAYLTAMSSSLPVYLGATPANVRTGGSGGTRVNAGADATPSDAWSECCMYEGVVVAFLGRGIGRHHAIFERKSCQIAGARDSNFKPQTVG